MGYEIEVYPDAREQITALPAGALTALAEAMVMLELTPWNGAPLHKDTPMEPSEPFLSAAPA